MNIFLKSLGFLALIALPLSVASQSGEDSEVIPAGQEVPALPNDVSSNGSFSYAVPFDLPEFRGLVPNVSLAYNSSNKAFGYERNLTGIGWSLTGFSMIELKTPGGGTPIYGSGQADTINIFMLDGEPLLACDDAAATNAWTATYPTDYKTDSPSASCSAGGNFASLHEDYRKIEKLATSWEITNPDGTKYTYQNLETLGAGTQAPTFTSKARFLLTSISDVNNNSISIAYTIAPFGEGYATRPASITYAGYTATFEYGDRGYDITYALGWQKLGRHSSLLEAVTIALNGQKIRAYDLGYELSAETARHRLTSVTEYGDNFVYNAANGVVSGSVLPPTTFDYSEEYLSYSNSWKPNKVNAYNVIADFDNDGIDEIYSPPVEQRNRGSTVAEYTLPELLIQFDANKNQIASVPGISPLIREDGDQLPSWRHTLGGLTSPNLTTGERYLMVNRRNTRDWSNKLFVGLKLPWDFEIFDLLNRDPSTQMPSAAVLLNTFSWQANKPQRLSGAFERDATAEIGLFQNWSDAIYQVDGTGFNYLYQTQFQRYGNDKFNALDYNGDGLTDLLQTWVAGGDLISRIHFGRGAGQFSEVESPNNTASGLGSGDSGIGDVNGDGVIDRVFVGRQSQELKVQLGTGAGGFHSNTVDVWATNLPSFKTTDYEDGFIGVLSSVRDINGDGLDDFIYHNGFSTNSVQNWEIAPVSLSAVVYLSTGNSFVPVMNSAGTDLYNIPNYVGSGDFNGDGKIDHITEWTSGSTTRFANSVNPNLLTEVTTPQGEVITVTYGSTTTNSDHETIITAQLGQNGSSNTPSQAPLASYPRFSGVQQVVSKIWRSSGQWPSRTYEFAYGPAYWVPDLRRFSGYEWVETTLPGSNNGNELRVRTTFDISSAGLGNVISTERYEAIDDGNGGEIENMLTRSVSNWQYGPSTRPFVAIRTEETNSNYVIGSYVNGSQNGASLISTTLFETNIFGQTTETAELGYTGGLAADRYTCVQLAENLSSYIVNTPSAKQVQDVA